MDVLSSEDDIVPSKSLLLGNTAKTFKNQQVGETAEQPIEKRKLGSIKKEMQDSNKN